MTRRRHPRTGEHLRRAAELATRPLAHGLDYAWVAATAATSARGMLRRDGWRPALHASPDGVDDAGAAPVILLPGVYESWHMLARVGRALAGARHPVGVVPDLGLNARTVADGAAATTAFLAGLDLTGVVLVAHSKGGLVGKAAMLGPEGHRVAGMVAIATPWRGSRWAQAFPPRSVVGGLRPSAPDLVSLARRTEVDARIVSLAPAWDPHVPGGSYLHGATNVRLAERGHFRPLGSPAVHALVARHVARLSGRPAARPD
ncbi:esterase/lipase family protein [Georgenia sp. Z1491]|uniref:esterase/lipase family protein n=1 Tax=Georgenia sp. Z1491 TaxID=3416707 RepID=UPI003CE8FA9E